MVGKKVLHKARLREITKNYKSFLSIILIAVLCVALFTGLFANYKNFQIKVQHFYEDTAMADYFITTQTYDSDDVSALKEQISELTAIEERIYLPLQDGNKTFTLIGVPKDSKISVPILQEGKEGVLVSKTFLEQMNCFIGSQVTLYFPLEWEMPTFVKEGAYDFLSNQYMGLTFTITGVMQHPEDVERNSMYSGLIYMDMDTVMDSINKALDDTYFKSFADKVKEQLSLDLFKNQIVITSKANLSGTLNTYFIHKEQPNLLSCLSRDSYPTNSSIEMDVLQSKQLLFVFPIVFYLVGVLVIITSLKELIHKERKNIGILSAMGFSKREIILHYSYISVILVSIGSLLGVIIGPLIIPNIMGRKYSILYNLPNTNLPFAYIEYLYCFLIIVGISILFGVLVSYKEVNQMPAVILRNEERKILKQTKKMQKKRWILPLKMSFRNMKLNLVRSFMVFIGVLGCSALLVCGFGIDNTLNYSVDKEMKELICYDLMISYTNNLDLTDQNIDSVDLYEKHSVIALNHEKSYNTSVYIFAKNLEIFKPYIPEDGCMISKRLSEDLNLKIGDIVSYIYNNESIKVEVKAVEELSFTSGIFIFQSSEQPFQPNGAYITLQNKEYISAYKNELLEMGAISVITNEEFSTQADHILSGIRGITLTVKVFAILLALVVIYNLAQLNYKERIRDIATLKVLGFGKMEIAQTLLYELTTLTLIGAVCGMFLGKPLLILLLKMNQTSKMTYIYHINLPSYFIAIGLTLIISILINLIITKLSDKIEMVESLKSVE